MQTFNLSALIDQASQRASEKLTVSPSLHAHIIEFSDPDMLTHLRSEIQLSEFFLEESDSGSWIGFFATKEKFARISEHLELLKSEFNDVLLREPFSSDWTQNYNQYQNFGIQKIYDYGDQRSVYELKNELIRLRHEKIKKIEDLHDLWLSHQKASRLGAMEVVDHLTDFIKDNFEGVGNSKSIRTAMIDLVTRLSDHAQKHIFMDRDYVRHISKGITDFYTKGCFAGQPGEIEVDLPEEFFDLTLSVRSQETLNTVYGDGGRIAEEFVKSVFPNLKPSFEIADESCDNTRSIAPFKGVPIQVLMNYRELDPINRYKGRGGLANIFTSRAFGSAEQRLASLHQLLANAISLYVLTIIRYQHEHAYEEALIDFSQRMNKESYADHCVHLIASTQPKLAFF